MALNRKSLFGLKVEYRDVHPSFEALRTQTTGAPARWMMEEINQAFTDPDGNFVQQLQSTGFDARTFELYLFAYLHFSGFDVDRTKPNPDFIVSRSGITAAVEATTVNPSTAGVLTELGKTVADLSGPEVTEYLRHELPIRFGGPLFSKLKRRYWELPHLAGLPLVFAIEAFHDDDALQFSDFALTSYLYGISHAAQWERDGSLSIEFDRLYSHILGRKEAPSSFFDQPDTENVSAVIFTNSGTTAKFGRMGYQHGIGVDTIDMIRVGYCLNEDPDARDPTLFSYNLDDPPFVEPWGQGLVVLHNPRAVNPLRLDFFPYAVQKIFDEGRPRTFVRGWHPISSKTIIIDLGGVKKKLGDILPLRRRRIAVGAISKAEFQKMCGMFESPACTEDGWFTDDSNSFLGVVLHDKNDQDWGFVVFARDRFFRFRAIATDSSFRSRDEARQKVQERIADLLTKPQRLFA